MEGNNNMNQEDVFKEEETIQNENPQYFQMLYYNVVFYLVKYGWASIFGFVLLMILWTNISKSLKNAKNKAKSMLTKKDDNQKSLSRMEAMQLAREKMQQQAHEACLRDEEKRKKMEEKKKAEKIEKHETLKSGSDGAGRTLRSSDFNPLGGTAVPRYRPTVRGTGGGG